MGIQDCLNKGPPSFPRGDNYEIAKIHWQNLKIFLSRTTGPILTKFGTKHSCVKGIQRISAFNTWWKKSENLKIKIFKKIVHCLASMCSSIVFNFLMKKIPMFKMNTYLVTLFLSEWGYCVNIEIPLRLSPASTFRAFKKYERSDVTFSHLWI